VVVYDGPAHGRSTGTLSSLTEFTDALFAVAGRTGDIVGLVGHSLGAAAVTIALGRGLRAERAVLLAPPEEMDTYAAIFAEKLAIPERVYQLMRANIEARFRIRWADLHLPTIAARLPTPALVVHDLEDVDVPWAQGSAVAGAWPGADFVSTTGLGHRGIVRDPAVLARVAAFLDGGTPR
jgi:pimeloyl-ACP methyl ester carboxylesterase